MRKGREQATVLRRSGMTYSDISKRMTIPRSTLSNWFKGQQWSNDIAIECIKRSRSSAGIRMVVMNTVRGGRLKKVYDDAVQDAVVDYDELKYHPLFISGIMIYWLRGDKTSKSRISVSSADVKVIKIFKEFIQDLCGVKKIHAHLILRKNLDSNQCISYWTQKSGLKYEDFGKSTYLKWYNQSKLAINRPNFGICNISLSSAYLKHKIFKWIELHAGIV